MSVAFTLTILFYQLVTNVFLGTILGIIDTWNDKIMFFIWVGIMLVALVLMVTVATPTALASLGIARFIVAVIGTAIGWPIGVVSYKETFQ